MTTPFFMRIQKTIDVTERLARQAKAQQDAMKARREVETPLKKKSIFGQAIRMAAGFTPDVVEDVGKAAGKGAWEGLQGWNRQVQSVPAALFTKGVVEDGQYTTERNLIGNPLANVKSHVAAQREVGIAPEGGNPLEDIGAGFKSARLAGKAYEEDPDIAQGTKFLTGVALDPTSYLAAGTVSKLPKIAKIGGAKGKLVRGAANVVEGFENPAQVGKFAIGGALGTDLVSRYNLPGVPEAVEQIAGGFVGGVAGAAFHPRQLKSVDTGLAKLQGREGKPAALGLSTEVVETGERVYHGTTTYIPEGTLVVSPKGDMTAGFYLSRDPDLASRLALEGGDDMNVTGFPQEFLDTRKARLKAEGGQQVMQFQPVRDLFFLKWDEYLKPDEVSRINNVLAKNDLDRVVTTEMTPPRAIEAINNVKKGTGALGVFDSAGFDGFSQDHGGYPQFVLFRPNELLKTNLTPPTVIKGSALNKSTTSSPIKDWGYTKPTPKVELKKTPDGKWEFEHPDGQISEGFSFDELYNWAKSYGYEPVYKGSVSELDTSKQVVDSVLSKLSNFDEQGNWKQIDKPPPGKVYLYDDTGNSVTAVYADGMKVGFNNVEDAVTSLTLDDGFSSSDIIWKGHKQTSTVPPSEVNQSITSVIDEIHKELANPNSPLKAIAWELNGDYANGFKDSGEVKKAWAEAKANKLPAQPSIGKAIQPEGIIKGSGWELKPDPVGGPNSYEMILDTSIGNQYFTVKKSGNYWTYDHPKGMLNTTSLDAIADKIHQVHKIPYDNPVKPNKVAPAIKPVDPDEIAGIKPVQSKVSPGGADYSYNSKNGDLTISGVPINGVVANTEGGYSVYHDGEFFKADSVEDLVDELDQVFGPTKFDLNKPKGTFPPILGIHNKKPGVYHLTNMGGQPLNIGQYKFSKGELYQLEEQLYQIQSKGSLDQIGSEQLNHIQSKLYGGGKYPYLGEEVPQPVTPEEIAGITKPTGPKSVDEFIEFTEKELGPQNKYGDAKDYAALGQEGAPIAGKPKGKGEVTPTKFGGKWQAAGYVDEDLGDLMDKLTKAGYKVNDPFGGVSGGALPETLITPITPEIGLTKGEKISNALAKVKRYITEHGVANNEIATPISKEYIRINHVMKTHATNMGKLAQRVEKLADIRHPEDIIDMGAISDEAKRAVEALQRSEEAFFETQLQMGVKKPLNPTDFWDELKLEEHAKDKTYSDMLNEYGNAVANKVSDEWLKQQINRLGETIKLSDEAGKPIPTSTVSGINTDVKLPKNVGEVLSAAVHKVHPGRGPDYAELYNAVNNQLRGMWAAGDASNQMIQMLPTWADNPKAAMRSTIVGFQTLKDPTVIADFILKHDELRYGTGKPTVTEYIAHNLHIAQASGQGTDLGGIGGKVQSIKGYGGFLKKSNTLFTETGNANRIALADYLWDQYEAGGAAMLTGIPLKGGTKVGAKEGMTRAQILDAIGEAANRATGYSQRGFGGPYGSALFFAPRFMQSQIEMIMKAAWGNQLENQVARRQLAKLVALGTGLTVSINELRGEETEFDPRSSNFMRIKNIGGTDISIFGPWDTLVRGVVRSAPTVDADGNVTFGDPTYIIRSKLSPVLSSSLDWITGENIVGDPSHRWESVLKNTLLPFSLRDVGQEPFTATTVGAFGGKATPLTESEVLDNKLKGIGIEKSDPEYLIKRREYLSEHPEDVPKASTEEFKRVQKVQAEIKARRKANDDLALRSGQTLSEFRENRKLLLTEQRNRLGEIIKLDNKKLDTKQRKWLNSYFELFDEESNRDFITGEILPEGFDAAVAAWANENGAEALDFVNRYMGAGLSTVESTYYNDMRKLEAAGYFDKPRYQNMKSSLTEDEIDSLVRAVDSFRVANPDIQEMSWAMTARRLLKDSIDNEELLDIIHSRLKAYQNPEITELKKQYAKEVLWFNPRADWNSYVNYKPGVKSGSSSGKLVKPKLGGALKANLKPTLK